MGDAVIVDIGGTVVGATEGDGSVVGDGSDVGVGVAVAVAVPVAVAVAVAVAVLEAVAVPVVFVTAGVVFVAAGVVAAVPDAEVDGFTTGPTVVPVLAVVGLTRALMIGESPAVPDRFVEPPIAFGLALARAAAGDSIGSALGAGQLVALHAMNPPTELDWDALVPYQQMRLMAPSTPVPITRFRTECGR